jgi:hypothetical protein
MKARRCRRDASRNEAHDIWLRNLCAAATPTKPFCGTDENVLKRKAVYAARNIQRGRPCCSSSTQFTGNSLSPRFQAWQVREDRDDRNSCSTIRLPERQRFPSSRRRRISHALKVASPTRFQLRDGGCRLLPPIPKGASFLRLRLASMQTPTVGRFAQRRRPRFVSHF